MTLKQKRMPKKYYLTNGPKVKNNRNLKKFDINNQKTVLNNLRKHICHEKQ